MGAMISVVVDEEMARAILDVDGLLLSEGVVPGGAALRRWSGLVLAAANLATDHWVAEDAAAMKFHVGNAS